MEIPIRRQALISDRTSRRSPVVSARCLLRISRRKSRRMVRFFVLFLSIWLAAGVQGSLAPAQQAAPPKPATQAPGTTGGISSAGTFAPVYDKDKRPIT